jgi:hypothetical protein
MWPTHCCKQIAQYSIRFLNSFFVLDGIQDIFEGIIKETVFFKKPTRIIGLTSDMAKAVPKSDRMLLRKDNWTGNFEIDVNTGCVSVNDLFFTSIFAFYAKPYSQRIGVNEIIFGMCSEYLLGFRNRWADSSLW